MASEKNLNSKKDKVIALAEKIKQAQTIVFADYRGLTVAQDTELRKKLREGNVEYRVIKNSITKFALEQNGITCPEESLSGPTAVAISTEDVIAPAKILYEFAKKNEALELKSGVIEGKPATVQELTALAAIPPKEVLLGQLLGLLTSPMRSLAVGLKAVADKTGDVSEGVETQESAE